jgi:hypothetical protein
VVTHQLHRASALYGTFGVVLGLLGWLYLQATVTLYCAEVDVVLARHHWPRSLRGPGTTEPDGQEAGPAVPVDIPHQGDMPQQEGRTPVDSMEAAQAGASQPEAGPSKALESKTASTRAVDSKAGNSESGQGASAA